MRPDLVVIAAVASGVGSVIGVLGTLYLNRRKQKHTENQDWYKAVGDIQRKFDTFKDKHLHSAVSTAAEKERLRVQAEFVEENHRKCEEKHAILEAQYAKLYAQIQDLHANYKARDAKQDELEKKYEDLQQLLENKKEQEDVP